MSKVKGKGQHPNSKANLKLFEKGNPGSSGRKRNAIQTKTIIRELLDTTGYQGLMKNKALIKDMAQKFGVKELSGRQLLVVAQIAKALKGDTAAFNAVMDRLDGKPKQVNENINTDMSYVDFLKAVSGDNEEDD